MRVFLMLVGLFVFGACGTQVDVSTSEALHNSWIEAMQSGDQEALAEMMVEQGQVYEGIPEASNVQIVGIDDYDYEEYGQVLGKSIWDEVCYIGTMSEVNGVWRMGLWREYPMKQCTRER